MKLKISFQIIFNSYRCLSCGVEGDKRLLPQFCHMKPQMVHPGDFLERHPSGDYLTQIHFHNDVSPLLKQMTFSTL